MIFVTGGAYQGKGKAAGELLGLSEQAFAARVLAETEAGRIPERIRAGEQDIILAYHEIIRRAAAAGEDTDALTKRVIAAHPAVVVMDEVGYGIVPIERAERDYREAVGRAGQLLAADAEAVYRVVCGIAQCIKRAP